MRKKVVNDLIGTSTEILQTFWHKDMSLLSHYLDDCKSQYKNVGLGQYKNVGFPTFLYCLFSLHLL